MTTYTDKGRNPGRGEYLGFDHLHFYVGNAYQAAAYYIARFGFEPYAYRGLETGSRDITTQVVRQNDIVFAFSSALEPGNRKLGDHLVRHGDGVKDVALRVDDCVAVFERATRAGARAVSPPERIESKDGCCVLATIEAGYADTWHTFVERHNFTGTFLPGYSSVTEPDPQLSLVPSAGLQFIDHCVANQADGQMEPAVNWYVKTLGFHRFWSVDDRQMHTRYSALRSIVVTDYFERVKMPINEPAKGLRKSQIQEFVEYYGGPGIQHIALNTNDIINAITRLRARGVSFIKVPGTYYEDLRRRLNKSAVNVEESLQALQDRGILVDFDEEGYLLQIFTKPVQDRPTVFMEVIQRHSHQGFGAGNFKSLFEAIEREQALRGNL